jgi:hypothetical protein
MAPSAALTRPNLMQKPEGTFDLDQQRAGTLRAADLPQPVRERHPTRRPAKRARHRVGGATKYTSARKRRSSRAVASSAGQR